VILLDTNLLTRLTNTAHQHGLIARNAIHHLVSRKEQIAIVPQNLYEFWAVATRTVGQRPAGENGLGFSIERASQWLGFFQRRFTLLPDREDVPARWQELVKTQSIRGFRAHDARLVAAMQCYGMTQLLTFNGADFNRLGITAIDPASV
jgi:predicted nucleic acid-binding protein